MGNAYIKDLNASRFLINFLLINLGEGREGGALMYVYVWEHIVSLYYTTVYELGRDEELMVPHLCLGFSANSAQGWIQGGAKIGQ